MMDALTSALILLSVQMAVAVGLASVGALFVRLPPSASLTYWRWVLASSLALALPPVIGIPVPAAGIFSAPAAVSPAILPDALTNRWTLSPWLVSAWLLGMSVRLGWLGIGLMALRRLRRHPSIEPLDRNLVPQDVVDTDQPRVYWHSGVTHPASFGMFRPIVLLPPSMKRFSTDAVRSVIRHEMWHVARRDWCWHVLEKGLLAVFWFHPAIWWVIDRIHLKREQVIDELVVEVTCDRAGYMGTLLRLADEPLMTSPALGFSSRRHLLGRMRALAAPPHGTPRRVLAGKLAMGGFLVASLTLACALGRQPQVFPPDDEDLTRPAVITRVSPNYTQAAHAAGIEGEVLLTGVVQPDGSVDNIRIVESLDAEHGLDEEARRAVGQWRFEPGRRKGVPVPIQVDINVAFTLQ